MELKYQIKTFNPKKKKHAWSRPLTLEQLKKLLSEKRIDGTEPVRVEGQEEEFGTVATLLNPQPPLPMEIVDIDDVDDDDFIYEDDPDPSSEAQQEYTPFAQPSPAPALQSRPKCS